MIRGNDFILNPDKLQEEFQLVEVSDWVDFSTKEKLGFYYTVLLPKLKFEKVKVGIKANTAIVTNEELEQKEHKKKAFFKSQNLKVPHETKVMLTEDILHDLQKENIVFQKEYTRQIYDTNAFLSTGSWIP